MRRQAQVVIVGGGVAGVALAYWLAKLGNGAEVVLLEKGELTSGSTWHAAGNVPHFMGSPQWARLHKRSFDIYTELAEHTGEGLGLHRCGSLKLATTEAELETFRAFEVHAQSLGIGYEVVSSKRAKTLFPWVAGEDIKGGAWTPGDGHLDPSSLTQTFAAEARKRGVEINRHQEVLSVQRTRKRTWVIQSAGCEVETRHWVNAAGLHSREVSRLVGHDLPAVPMERLYLVTESVAQITEADSELPVLRDVSAPLYARQEGDSLLLGLYDREPVFWALDGTPKHFDQALLPPDLERVDEALQRALRRIPILQTAGIRRVVNGPLMRTPDASPLVGPVPGFENFWLNTGYFAGIAQAGSCTEILARCILDADPPGDVRDIEPERFDSNIDQAYTLRMTRVAYAEELARAESNE